MNLAEQSEATLGLPNQEANASFSNHPANAHDPFFRYRKSCRLGCHFGVECRDPEYADITSPCALGSVGVPGEISRRDITLNFQVTILSIYAAENKLASGPHATQP
jgi:hypothetical protein